MPPSPPAAPALDPRQRDVLYAIGCGLTDAEIAASLAIPERAVAGHLGRILATLRLRDRAAAIVHAFDCGLVQPGHGPRRKAADAPSRTTVRGVADRAPGAGVRISLLGPPRAWQAGRPVPLGPVRQQAVLAALALRPGRAVGTPELLDRIWGTEPPIGNVVPVYIYRLRKILCTGHGAGADPVIEREQAGYRLNRSAVEVDVAHAEELAAAATRAERAGDLAEAVRACSRALDLFYGEPLAGLPERFAELERLRLTEHRITLAQRKAGWQLRLGRTAEATAELSALAAAHPLDEQVVALLMRALHQGGRPAEALAVFDRTHRRLREELGVAPGELLRRTRRAMLSGAPRT
ncbi:BTAD domain-containing putative transcriptional regulator [Streptomyces sp. SP17BM10]|uniref:BTAD domain-containing putative transcriptional regulator n=1 Tax=Streptomyces sp. SP17BM10 TaxID=3002530 RepID=UPI002E77DF48|nr:BTAD domain-containing putative transcriptional regulator [Streptomyces sp. SP17BM10]MEE1786559.1 BTAD domain-containing putative transcriptional regulator [Streptomyces sp. SP17BM10]